jgi:PKD domain
MTRAPLVVALLGALLASAPAASAHPVAGVVPDVPSAQIAVSRPLAYRANLPYGGGPVLHSNRTHLIFWQPSGSGLKFDPGYEALIEQFLQRVAADSHNPGNEYGLTGQYADSQGPAAYTSTYDGATVDTDRLPPRGCDEPLITGPGWTVCVNDRQLQAEIEHVIHANHLPTGSTDVYFMVTPKGLGSCTDTSSTSCALGGAAGGYCGYHSQSSDGSVLYAVIPYNAVAGHCESDNPRPNASTADPTLSTLSHEHAEMVTDPSGDAWIDASGNEAADMCITSFGPSIGGSGSRTWNEKIHGGHYYLQELWSNADDGCRPRARPASIAFSSSAPPGSPLSLTFSARGRGAHGPIVSYTWFFGDGRSGHGTKVTHRYQHAGRDRVVLRATDNWQNWTYDAETLTVRRRGRAAADANSGSATRR